MSNLASSRPTGDADHTGLGEPTADQPRPTTTAPETRRDEHRDEQADDQPSLLGAPWPLGWRTAGVLLAWCLGVIAVFTAVGEILVRTPIDDADREVARDIVDQRTGTGNDISPWAAGLSDTLVKIIATTIIVGIMFAVWRRWRDPLVVAVSLIFEATAFIVVTTITSRPRPEVERLQESPVNSSYPSGHVAAATAYFAIALVVSRHLRSTWAKVVVWATPVLIVLTVAAARMYQGMHYASDVIAGIILGVISVVIVDRVIPRDATAADSAGVTTHDTTHDTTHVTTHVTTYATGAATDDISADDTPTAAPTAV